MVVMALDSQLDGWEFDSRLDKEYCFTLDPEDFIRR